MKQIRVVIIDDEPIAIEVIKELIDQLTDDLSVVGVARNGLEAMDSISTLKPDLVFMGVDMPLMNGVEVLETLFYKSFQLVFTTGFESKQMKSVRHLAIDSLLKPIDPADFLSAVKKARQQILANDVA